MAGSCASGRKRCPIEVLRGFLTHSWLFLPTSPNDTYSSMMKSEDDGFTKDFGKYRWL